MVRDAADGPDAVATAAPTTGVAGSERATPSTVDGRVVQKLTPGGNGIAKRGKVRA